MTRSERGRTSNCVRSRLSITSPSRWIGIGCACDTSTRRAAAREHAGHLRQRPVEQPPAVTRDASGGDARHGHHVEEPIVERRRGRDARAVSVLLAVAHHDEVRVDLDRHRVVQP